jgi:hypothetical protein
VLVVLIQGDRPRNLLRHRVDLHGTAHCGDGGEHVGGHLRDGTVRGERNPFDRAAAVLYDRVVRV